MDDLERRIRERAHLLWKEASEGHGREGYYWARAAELLKNEAAAASPDEIPIDQQIDRVAGRLAREDDVFADHGPGDPPPSRKR